MYGVVCSFKRMHETCMSKLNSLKRLFCVYSRGCVISYATRTFSNVMKGLF